MIVGDLFSGIGGFSLAAEWMGWRTAWFSEVDPYACRVLAHHWPNVPNLGDIRAVDWTTVPRVDVLTGGFPCQPHSLAGQRKGSTDERDLFDEIIRCARVLRPRFLVLENVPGLFTSDAGRFFGRVLGALAACGYDAEWRVVAAADVGAPHKRDRVWIVAYAAGAGWERGERSRAARTEGRPHGHVAERGKPVEHAYGGRCEQRDASEWNTAIVGARHVSVGHADGMEHATSGGRRAGGELEIRRALGGRAGLGHADSERGRCGSIGSDAGNAGASSQVVRCWQDAVPVRGADGKVRLIPREAAEGGPESPLWPVAHGVSGRVARLRGIGNSIVPQVAIEIFRRVEMIAQQNGLPMQEAA